MALLVELLHGKSGVRFSRCEQRVWGRVLGEIKLVLVEVWLLITAADLKYVQVQRYGNLQQVWSLGNLYISL